MTGDFKITLGEARRDGRGHVVIDRQFEYPDGTVENGVYVMPEDQLEWRIAEYDLDPDDLDSVMEIVLAECHMEALSDDETHYLFTAETIEDARAEHLRRCGAVWAKHFARSKSRNGSARHVPANAGWKNLFVVHDEATDLKRRLVGRHRETIRLNRERMAADPHAARVERLRRELEGHPDAKLHKQTRTDEAANVRELRRRSEQR